MGLFLSKEKQLSTDTILSIGFWFTPEKQIFNVITAQYFDNSIEYYLFNKIKIWMEKAKNE